MLVSFGCKDTLFLLIRHLFIKNISFFVQSLNALSSIIRSALLFGIAKNYQLPDSSAATAAVEASATTVER